MGHSRATANYPLSSNEIAAFLRSTPIVLRNLAAELPERTVSWHPHRKKWCIKQVIGHLVEEDKRDFVGRIRLMLDEDEPSLLTNDQDVVARMRRDCDKGLKELLAEFDYTRAASVDFVSNLKKRDCERAGTHPRVGHICVRELLNEWIYHDLNHLRQIASNTQRFLWNELGHMQRFYEP